jgi:hypothetical protein
MFKFFYGVSTDVGAGSRPRITVTVTIRQLLISEEGENLIHARYKSFLGTRTFSIR